MAWDATDWTITRSTGDIRYTGDAHGGGSPTYVTVIDFHRELQKFADDASSSGDDQLDITDENPSARSTDNIVTLLGTYNIDDTASEHIYDGSIIQGTGDTETYYDGIVNYGNASVQIQILQNGKVNEEGTAAGWWNFSGGGLNPDAAQGISHRFMLKTREFGVDIDGRRIVGTCRTLNDSNQNTYSEFGINGTSRGNNVLALADADDLNNNSTATTIATWDQFANDNEGYVGIDVNNDSTDEYYYSSWDIGGGATPASPDINDLYEYAKYVTRSGSTSSMYAIDGDLFRGITHEITYQTEVGTGPVEEKLLVWGTEVAYDTGLTTPGTPGEYYDFSLSGAKGLLLAVDDTAGVGWAVFATDGTTVVDDDVVTRADATASDGFTVNATINNNGVGGGVGMCLADNTTTKVWIQLLTGVAPVDALKMHTAEVNSQQVPIGASTTYDTANSVDVNTTITSRTLSFPFFGVSTGSAIIGSYGLGVDKGDLTQNDKLFDLTATQYSPPNIPRFTVGGLDTDSRVLVAPWDGVSTDNEGFPAIEVDQYSLQTTLDAADETAVVVSTAIATDTPNSGTIRIELDTGFYRRQAYTSWDTSTFTIASSDYLDPNDALATNNVYVSYIDDISAGASLFFDAEYKGTDQDLVVIVRDGANTPIKQFIQSAAFGDANTTVTAIRTTDE